MADCRCHTEDCHCQKKKHRTEEELRALCNRLNRIEGQIRGIRSMLEEDAYCVDILTQTAAVTAALNAFKTELLAQHVRTCVADDLRAGNGDAADELADILKKLLK